MSLVFCRCRYCDRPFPAPVRVDVCPACYGFRATLRALRDGKALLPAPRSREWTTAAPVAAAPVRVSWWRRALSWLRGAAWDVARFPDYPSRAA